MTNDGTQDPGPPPVLSDPSAGLVTGSHYAPEPLKVRVVEPPMPDISAVREAMAGMLDEDSELNFDLVHPAVSGSDSPAERTAEIPAQASSPENAPEEPSASEPDPTPPAGIPAQARPATSTATVPEPGGGTARMATSGNVEQPRRLPVRLRRERPPKPAGAIRRKSSAPGVTATIVLLLVIAVLVIVLIASFLDTIGSLFA
ncbi:hypothetical protein [Actinophytocola gossypii]|uniref:Uncharacterized protein n=1 Tax=Actinophytocola gossypii TaxID=2812003 RepID=A0ABT2J3R8_9PSEU|nr:hypothetical protein [Actinophytocola gossypii]MCT2582508.1 hypothetical protein [Actinophytocola gossypii]